MIYKVIRHIVIAALLLGVLLIPVTVHAFDPFATLCANGAATKSAVCVDKKNSGDPIAGPNGVIRKTVNVIALVAGIASIIILILAGLTFVMAGGEAGKVKQAQDMAKYALIGLFVIAAADSILSFVLSKL